MVMIGIGPVRRDLRIVKGMNHTVKKPVREITSKRSSPLSRVNIIR